MKKLFCLLLSLTLLLTLCSCGATEEAIDDEEVIAEDGTITDEEIVALIDGDIQIGKYLSVEPPSYDWENSIDGKYDWFPVVKEGLETWDEWEAYIYSIYSGEKAEYALSHESFADIDGKLYCTGFAGAYVLTDDYVYEVLENADGTAKVKITNPDVWGESAREYTLVMTLTDDGWRVSGQE